MRVREAIICDQFTKRNDNNWDALGLRHDYRFRSLPTQVKFTLALAIDFEPHDRTSVKFGIEVVDPDGHPLVQRDGRAATPPRPDVTRDTLYKAEPFELEVRVEGDYEVLIRDENGKQLSATGFEVHVIDVG
jgi:hypothetical protein